MKKQRFISILFLFHLTVAFAQVDETDSLYLKTVKEFELFISQFSNKESDISIEGTDSISRYNVVFSVSAKFADPKTGFSRTIDVQSIRKSAFHAEIKLLYSILDSLKHSFRGSSCQLIKTSLLHDIWKEPLMDSLINVQSEPSFWASCISAKEIQFSIPTDEALIGDFGLTKLSGINVPSIISYENGKYLIIDVLSVLTYIGGQTDYGLCYAYFLERID